MNDLTRQSARLIEEGRALRDDNRRGGRHRKNAPIGEGSRGLRQANRSKRIAYFFTSIFGIVVAAMAVGLIANGIGFWGVMLAGMAMLSALIIFAQWPKVKVPGRAMLAKTQDAKQLVARTELWLEHQRPALPPPAIRLVDDIGVQLDALGAQLAHVDPAHPAAAETRKLVGELLPETVDTYRKIPASLRGEKRAGATPDEQLVGSLGKISREIDQVTRKLAEGSLDDLAVKTRYLDYKYGDPDSPVADTEKN